MKIIAWHLPQFHTIPENDKWWGKGFTEWTNTKKAKPLFKGHQQPKEPLNDNYYNLLDKETMKWQAKISEENGIYGFCYYHYWFNGKMLLEKPVENLLEWKEINQKFCFSWANEPWSRTWSGQNKKVLMPQEYGSEKEWEEHFNYLLKFFKDERYIRVEEKPLFLIYRTENIPNCTEMIGYWKELALKNDLKGLHIVETLNNFQSETKCENSDALVYMEPMLTVREISKNKSILWKIKNKIVSKIQNVKKLDYDYLWKIILDRNYIELKNKKQYLGSFISWDNTARKGKKGLVVTGSTPEKFEFYMKEQIENTEKIDSEFIFINAWNEWAEGTYLEPDKENGDTYLNKIKKLTQNIKEKKQK